MPETQKTERMRIGFDAKRAFFNRSGLGNYSRNTISILSRHASENEYFLFSHSTKNSIEFEKKTNIQVKTAKGLYKIFTRLWRSYKIADDLLKNNIDVYHGLSNELPYNIKKSGVSSVVTIHDLIFLRFPDFYHAHDRKIYQSKFFKSCENANRIIAISEQTKKDIVHFFDIPEHKIDVVYQGCDPLFNKKSDEIKLHEIKEKYNLPDGFILNVGTIEERKNIFAVIKSLNENKITIPLVIIGRKTAYYTKIKEYILQQKMHNQILFYHDVPFKDLPGFYQLSDLFIYPSLFEGFGIPILEAISSKIPVITNKEGCFKEAAGGYSLLIDVQNSDEIAHSINRVLSDTELRNKMTLKSSDYITMFSEENICKKLIHVYNKVFEDHD